jgi:2-dehydropantoate 2-reductase
VGTHVAEPGVIEQKGGNGRIIFGDDQINGTKAAVQTAAVLKELGISGDYLPNPDVAIWTKYLFIAAYGIVTAATGKTLGAVYENNQLKRNVKEIMIEIVKLASQRGVVFDEAEINSSLDKAKAFPYEAKTSFQRDFENPSKKNEKELFVDNLLAMAEEFKVNVPMIKYYNLRLEGRVQQ